MQVEHIGPHILYCGDCRDVLPTLKGGLNHMFGGVAPRTLPTVTVGTLWGSELDALRELNRISFETIIEVGELTVEEVQEENV